MPGLDFHAGIKHDRDIGVIIEASIEMRYRPSASLSRSTYGGPVPCLFLTYRHIPFCFIKAYRSSHEIGYLLRRPNFTPGLS